MIKIKQQYKDHFIGFKEAKGRTLGLLSQDDLICLAKIGLSSKDKTILDIFDGPLPDLSDLKKAKLLQSAPEKETDKTNFKDEERSDNG